MFLQFLNFFRQKRDVILIAAGGTGGHIIPALMIADRFLKKDCEVIFVTDRRFDNYKSNFDSICNNSKFKIHYINIPNLFDNIILKRFSFLLFAFIAVFKICKIIFTYKVRSVIGFGSYVSLPSIFAGWLCGLKVFLHEQNSHMGLSNRIAMFFVKIAMVSFSKTSGIPRLFKYKAIITGFPLRDEVLERHYHNTIDTINYSSFFKIYDKINILVLGGSQGAKIFQDIVPRAISLMHESFKNKIKVYHQVNKEDVSQIISFYHNNAISAEVSNFFANAPELMSSTHVVISRSGAGTAFEIMALGVPAILVPYPFATNQHQLKNALFMQQNGAAVLIEQKDLTANKLAETLTRMFNDQGIMPKLSHNAKQLSNVDADFKIIFTIEKIVGKFGSALLPRENNYQKAVPTNISIG